jgi:PAS domain S-box-containing protein
VRPWFRASNPARLALPVLIVLLGIAGYLVMDVTIRGDRKAAAARRAQIESVRADGVLARARAYVAGLGGVLAGEQRPSQRRFSKLVGSTASTVGLVDALWVERVPSVDRRRYERLLGRPITRLTASGRYERAPVAPSYLPATFTSMTRPELRRGVDVSNWRALAPSIRDRRSIFAVTASGPGSLGGEPGFYVLQAARFGLARRSRGVVALFVPTGWLTSMLEGDPQRVAISLDGRRIEGGLDSAPAASGSFMALGRNWRIDVGSEPASALQSLLPWLALVWPIATALIVLLVGRAIVRRRRAERDFARIFNLSLDLLAIAGFDGYLKRVNPAFERTVGYSSRELLSRPFLHFIHPDDRAATRAAVAQLARVGEVTEFENRHLCADGSVRWLQWSARALPDEGLTYGVAKDVTDRKRADAELREAQQRVEESRDELRVLADEQAALRRVATLVAQDVSPTNVFAAVCEEVGRLLGADSTSLVRYEPDGTATVVASHGEEGVASELGDRSNVGAPIVVEGRPWGVMITAWKKPGRLSPDTEHRMAQFTELVATAIANADSRTQLAASRARIVDAADEERRRVVRDLHDGAQQRLVHTVVTLRLAREQMEQGGDEMEDLVNEALENAERATSELGELARGIHPTPLSRGGLRAAVDALISRLSLPVAYDVSGERFPPAVERNAYFVVSEALANVVKHSGAHRAEVLAHEVDGVLRIEVRDDGAGGARLGRGSGLIGVKDRAEALGGRLVIVSPEGGGTLLRIDIPVNGG